MRTSEKKWFRGLVGGVISASASAGSSFLGMAGAHGIGIDVPLLNWKSLGVLLLTSGLLSAFLFLKQSPLPPDDDTTIITRQTTTQGEVLPGVVQQVQVTEVSKVKTEKPEEAEQK
jgi:hypothetical protein